MIEVTKLKYVLPKYRKEGYEVLLENILGKIDREIWVVKNNVIKQGRIIMVDGTTLDINVDDYIALLQDNSIIVGRIVKSPLKDD